MFIHFAMPWDRSGYSKVAFMHTSTSECIHPYCYQLGDQLNYTTVASIITRALIDFVSRSESMG